jgi:hypothetical protein
MQCFLEQITLAAKNLLQDRTDCNGTVYYPIVGETNSTHACGRGGSPHSALRASMVPPTRYSPFAAQAHDFESDTFRLLGLGYFRR